MRILNYTTHAFDSNNINISSLTLHKTEDTRRYNNIEYEYLLFFISSECFESSKIKYKVINNSSFICRLNDDFLLEE